MGEYNPVILGIYRALHVPAFSVVLCLGCALFFPLAAWRGCFPEAASSTIIPTSSYEIQMTTLCYYIEHSGETY